MELKRHRGVILLIGVRSNPLRSPHPRKSEDIAMTLTKTLAFSTALVAAIGFAATPRPAHALGTGAAVGIGLGAFAQGTAIGAGAAYPYGYPGSYGYYGYPAYYGSPYYAPGSCWSPYYGRYVPC